MAKPKASGGKSKQNNGASVEPASAEADFKLIEPRLKALSRVDLAAPNVDVQVAATVALGVATICAGSAIRKRFKNLAKSGEYDDQCVDDLPAVARAAWYARHKLLLTSATQTEAQLPLSVIEEASALRARMLKCAEYHLGDDPGEASTIAAIRTGQGYQDLANDLIGLADVYKRRKVELTHDKRSYRASDITAAKNLAGRIMSLLAASSSVAQGQWVETQSRAWTLLLQVYEEVCRGGRFLFAREHPESMFPSLVASARARSSPKPESDGGAVEGEPSKEDS